MVREPVEWRDDFIRDVYASTVRVVLDELGRPSEREAGAEPAAMWDLANGGSFRVSVIEGAVFISVASAEWARIGRALDQ